MNSLLDLDKLSMAAGAVASDEQGRPRGLYREHCAHCHGVTGDGIGPSARYLDPYPRDFRRGVYKFKSTPKGRKPTDDDLKRVLVRGIPGTAMPSYAALAEEELDALVHYVKYLSIRGEVERVLIDYAASELESDEPLIDLDTWQNERAKQVRLVRSLAERVVRKWAEADSHVTAALPRDARRDRDKSLARGRDLFLGDVASCFKCHGKTGRGDGQTNDFDDWAKEIEPANADAVAAYRRAGALPPRNIRPRNFRQGVFRGGREPEDLYRRIRNGIDGTPMPEALFKEHAAPANSKGLSAEDIWCLVDYVRSLASEPPK
jgi:mono/diheme cytochrome c family protein